MLRSVSARATWFAALGTFLSVCVSLWAMSALRDRDQTIRAAQTALQAVIALLDRHAEHAIEAADRVVHAGIALVRRWDLREEYQARAIHERLRGLVDAAPAIKSAWVLDADGITVLDTWQHPSPRDSDAHQAFFREHQAGDRALRIDAVGIGTRTGRPRFTMSRAVRTDHDAFRGVVVAGVDSEYFRSVYAEAGLGPRAVVALLTRTGDVLAVWPPANPGTPAGSPSEGNVFPIPATSPERGVLRVGHPDGERLFAYQRLADFPVVVVASAAMSDVLAPWRRRMIETGLLTLIALAGFSGLVGLGLRSVRRESEVRTELEAANASLEARVRARTQELEQRNLELIESSRAKDQFLAMLGHELRNPLGAIRNAASVLERAGRAHERHGELIQIVSRQSAHLTRLVDDLLDVARVRSGKITLQRSPLDLAEIVRRAVNALGSAGRTERHRIVVDAVPTPVNGDATRLEQVVLNLVDNALKFTPAGGEIRLVVAPRGREAVVSVRDTGCGISADALERIFDVFAQAHPPTDGSSGGLGLGLTLVRSLVQLHGGTVTASSAGPGRGTEFVVALPRAPAAGTVDTARADGGPPSKPRRILVVEDHEDARASLRMLLEQSGHTVIEALDGPSGLTVALAERPDVAFVDIALPGFDGYTFARRLRETCGESAPVLIAVTGFGQPADRARSAEAGFAAHLTKPVDPTALAAALDLAA